jgi:hypothetical protein
MSLITGKLFYLTYIKTMLNVREAATRTIFIAPFLKKRGTINDALNHKNLPYFASFSPTAINCCRE